MEIGDLMYRIPVPKWFLLIFGIIFGLISVVISFLIFNYLPVVKRNLILKDILLTKESFAFSKWSSPDHRINLNVWLYNLTNHRDLYSGDDNVKPHYTVRGPYTFRETQRKANISIDSLTKYVTYRTIKSYFYDQNSSCHDCSPDDLFIVPNVPYFTILNKIDNFHGISEFTKTMVGWALIDHDPFLMTSADSLMFKGYRDKLLRNLDTLTDIPAFLKDLLSLPQMGRLPERMGFFYGKNNSDGGNFTINSGSIDYTKLGRIIKWNNKTELNAWNDNNLNKILGTDGSVFPPFLNKTDVLQIFAADLCRSIFAVFHSEVYVEGLKAYRFYVPKQVFDWELPENRGYCKASGQKFYQQQPQYKNNPNDNETKEELFCMPDGLLNLTECRHGAPIIISAPNFLYSPQYVIDSVTGLSPPNLENDAIFFDIEPTTGVLLNAAIKIQVNVAVHKIKKLFKQIKPIILPVLMVNGSARVSSTVSKSLYTSLVLLPTLAHSTAWFLLFFGSSVTVLCIVLLYLGRNDNKEDLDKRAADGSNAVVAAIHRVTYHSVTTAKVQVGDG